MNVLKILNQLYPFHFTKIKFVSLFYFKLKWYNYEDDAEKIDALGIVGKEPGQDLVVTSWASAAAVSPVRYIDIEYRLSIYRHF